MQRHAKTATAPNRILPEIASIVTFALGVFVLAALVSYDANDPSLLSNAPRVAANACGWVGAYLSALLLLGLGIGAFVVPAALICLAVAIHTREGFAPFMGILGGASVALASLAVFLTIQWKFWAYGGQQILTGGALGAWLAELLLDPFNQVGASVVSAMIFLIALVLSTPLSVSRFLGRAIAWSTRTLAKALWKTARGTATFLAYLAGWIVMKGAHATGGSLKLWSEGALKRARERAHALRSQWKQEDEDAERALAEPRSEPTVGPDLPSDPPLLAQEIPSEIDITALKKRVSEIKIETPQPDAPVLEPATSAQKAGRQSLARPKSKGPWKLPTTEFLRKPPKIESSLDRELLLENSKKLEKKFQDFGIEGEVTAVRPGPVITLYEFKPGPGIKVSRIASLSDDLSMALSAESVRILAPLPGKSVVGIEIPSDHREKVFLREFLQHPDFFSERTTIPVVMGKDIGGTPMLSDLARMPHLLCAGQTGSGKSVFMNSLICSLVYRFTPDDLRMILVDPKFIEFRAYQDIPHLLLPVVDDPKNASTTLKWAVREMERRYRILATMGVRNLTAYNAKVDEMGADTVSDLLNAESENTDWAQAYEPDESGAPKIGKLPYIVIIIDELADLMMVARKEVEISIARIAQKARAAGIHLVIATQRPSTDVITGLIKANLPSRVSFKLASHVDSKTILDRAGAERLLGQGDMLFVPPGTSHIQRLHGSFVDDDEINKITAYLRSQGEPIYRDEILTADDEEEADEDSDSDQDELFEQAVELVRKTGHASASFLQRHLKVGYNRAARMIETMETKGIVGPAEGARPREVLM